MGTALLINHLRHPIKRTARLSYRLHWFFSSSRNS